MKTKLGVVLPALLAFLIPIPAVLYAQGTAFTYQGRLNDGSNPANGSYDLRFIVYDNSVGGNQQGPILTNTATAVSNGLFTVTMDFGNVFPGAARWLDIAVRTNGSGAFTGLSTRQALTPAPYAITAGNVISGGLTPGTYGSAVSFTNAGNQFSGNGSGLFLVNAATLGGQSAANFWQLGGNVVGPFQVLGSVNNQPIVIEANNQAALQLAYASNSAWGYSPNIIGGFSANTISAGVVGATIAGGGRSGLLTQNTVGADFGTVVGGSGNSANGKWAIAGGNASRASGLASVALGGGNTASGTNSVALGNSAATNSYATAMGGGSVAGGYGSTAMGAYSMATGDYSTAAGNSSAGGIAATATGSGIAGGDYSVALGLANAYGANSVALGGSEFFAVEADGASSFAAGGASKATYDYCFVWSDGFAPIPYEPSGPNQFLIHAQGGVGIGLTNPAAALHVASQTTGTPQVQITQQNASDSVRLRMNSGSNLAWEMDVAAGSSPQLQFWYVGAAGPRLIVDTGGNLYATSFNNTSDKNAKENFAPINVQDVLDKVTALPITRWNFKTDTNTIHVGPMAQDFYTAFDVGTDDKHIATVDEEGVALAAIQGLNQRLTKELEQKETEITELEQRLVDLEKKVANQK